MDSDGRNGSNSEGGSVPFILSLIPAPHSRWSLVMSLVSLVGLSVPTARLTRSLPPSPHVTLSLHSFMP